MSKKITNLWKKLEKPILVLAPMAGYTNSSFRRICKKYGADVVYSEMASATALNFAGKRTLELLEFAKTEKPYIVQLFGNDPKYFKNAAKIVTEKIKPDGIDINMGCPVKKIYDNGSGAALMEDWERAREIIIQALEGTKLPVSIKIRSAVGKISALKFVEKIKDLPISAIMIHGRSFKQGFAGAIDYEAIRKVKEIVDIPVIANGGVNAPEAALLMIEKTGADGIGVARGALTKPWLFFQIRQLLSEGVYKKFDLKEIKKIALEHSRMSCESGGKHGILEMRKYLLWYFRGFENAKEARRELVRVETVKDIENVLRKI